MFSNREICFFIEVSNKDINQLYMFLQKTGLVLDEESHQQIQEYLRQQELLRKCRSIYMALYRLLLFITILILGLKFHHLICNQIYNNAAEQFLDFVVNQYMTINVNDWDIYTGRTVE